MIEIKFDASQLAGLANRFHNAQAHLPEAIATAVKTVGPEAMSAMKSALPGQTGLKRKTIDKALKGSGRGATYTIYSHGGNIRLKYFGARETARGVSAAPWNSRRVYASTFIKSGWWPKRVKAIAGGQVLRRKGAAKYPMEVVRSGLFIPEEMIKGPSASAFFGTIDARLAPTIEAVVLKAL